MWLIIVGILRFIVFNEFMFVLIFVLIFVLFVNLRGFVINGCFWVLILFNLWLLWIIKVISGWFLLDFFIIKVFIVFLIGKLNCFISLLIVFVFGVLIKYIFVVGVWCLFIVIVFVSLIFVVKFDFVENIILFFLFDVNIWNLCEVELLIDFVFVCIVWKFKFKWLKMLLYIWYIIL